MSIASTCRLPTVDCKEHGVYMVSWREPGGWHLVVCGKHLERGVAWAMDRGQAKAVIVRRLENWNGDPGPRV